MYAVKVLGEFYFSQLLGKAVYDAARKRVGRVRDMTVRWHYSYPEVSGIKYVNSKDDLIPFDLVERCDAEGVFLCQNFSPSCILPLQEEEIYISKWLLDKQIIDLKGFKLVRVNDITLSWLAREDGSRMVLVAVDIGIRGLFRRLGLEFLFKCCKNKLVSWQYIKPLESWNAALQLNMEKQQLEQIHPADIADLLEEMDYKRRSAFIEHLNSRQTIDALAELELETQVEIFRQMEQQQALTILAELPPDEVADILGELPVDKMEGLLDLMADEAEGVRELLQYADGTAGACMTTKYIRLSGWMTVSQALGEIRTFASTVETIYYLYVMNERGCLEGVLSLRELIVAEEETVLYDLMRRKVVAVSPEETSPRVAGIMAKYGFLAIPVVDGQGKMLGLVTVDDILSLLVEERDKFDAPPLLAVSARIGRERYR